MRFMHIADLHLGKQFKDMSLLEDQRYILDQIADIAERARVDAVLIAGDVYQRSSPQAEAMTLFNDFITRLCADGIKSFIISGNHDSDQRIAYFSALIRSSGVHVSERFDGSIQKVTLSDAYGRINIHLLPFIKPANVRGLYPGERINTYQDAVAQALRSSPVDPRERNVLLCHQFITGAEKSDSEEMAVGGLDNIDASLFDAYDYVALGHIHKPQHISRDTMRYAGSPLKYSLSEVDREKSVVIVDMLEKGDVDVKTVPLYPLHDMRRVEGMYADIMDMEPSDDYVAVIIHDEEHYADAKLDIRNTVFRNMFQFTIENSKSKETCDVDVTASIENKSPMELFIDFYRLQNNGVPPTEEHLMILETALKELEDEKA